jgi:large subunit ribosomal protein L3
VQITTGTRRATRVSKGMAGHFAKANVAAGRGSWEFRLEAADKGEFAPGAELKVDMFKEGQKVDVTGTSIGKGYAGTIKRHHFAGQDRSHGNSVSHRAPGSIGQRQTPGRVFPGKRMSGHLGAERNTTTNLVVVKVDVERNLLLVKGAVPGSEGGDLIVRPTSRG